APARAAAVTPSLPDALPLWPVEREVGELGGELAAVDEDRGVEADGAEEGVAELDVPVEDEVAAVDVGDFVLNGNIELRYPFLRSDRKSTRLNSSHVKISYAV